MALRGHSTAFAGKNFAAAPAWSSARSRASRAALPAMARRRPQDLRGSRLPFARAASCFSHRPWRNTAAWRATADRSLFVLALPRLRSVEIGNPPARGWRTGTITTIVLAHPHPAPLMPGRKVSPSPRARVLGQPKLERWPARAANTASVAPPPLSCWTSGLAAASPCVCDRLPGIISQPTGRTAASPAPRRVGAPGMP